MSEPKLSSATRASPFLRATARALSALGLLALASGSPPGARAAPQAALNAQVTVRGIARVTDLRAQTGTAMGTIDLTWTEPGRNLTVGPHAYQLRVSTTGQIDNEGDFNAAQDLSVFSPTPVPTPGPGGALVALQVA